jgi:hypothetical protein
VGAQLLIGPVVLPFSQEVEVEVGERGREAVGVIDLQDLALAVDDLQPVRKNFAAVGEDRLEEAVGMDPFHPPWAGLRAEGNNPSRFGERKKGSHGHERPIVIADKVRSQDAEGVAVVTAHDRLDLRRGERRARGQVSHVCT